MPAAAVSLGLVLGDDLALDHLGRLGRAFSWNLVLFVHGEGSLELADALAHRLAQLGQALRPEDDQDDHQDYGDLEWSDVWHSGTFLSLGVDGRRAARRRLAASRCLAALSPGSG